MERLRKSDTPIFTPTLPAPETPTTTPTKAPLKYVFPVSPLKYVNFGEGYAGHGYYAVDISAPEGYEFLAVTDGVVEFVSYEDKWDPATDDPALQSGLAVAIIGDDGWRYYGSHLSAIADGIATGVRVTAGQVLGYVGDSGNARGRGTHVHFGISHPTYPEDWQTRRGEIDPFPLLTAWKKGENVMPEEP